MLGVSLCLGSGCDEPLARAPSSRSPPSEVAQVHQVRRHGGGITLIADNEIIELALTPSYGLLAPDAVVVRDGLTMTPAEAGLVLPYEGQVVGEPGSWARMRLDSARVEGLIFHDSELWEVRADEDGRTWMSAGNLRDYLDEPTGQHHQCEATAESTSEPAADTPVPRSGCREIDVALVADHTHVESLGGVAASEAEMLARLNESDGIFRDDLDIGFSVSAIETFSSSGGHPFNDTSSGGTPLEEFADFKQSNYPQAGLAHLFVSRTTGGTVGRAYIGRACASKVGSAVSNYLGSGRKSTVVVAHELGHNLGARHDEGSSEYIMNSSVRSDAREFSDKSDNEIYAHVASADCFEPCGSGPPPTERPPGSTPAGTEGEDECFCDPQCHDFDDCCAECCGHIQCSDDDERDDQCYCDPQCDHFGDCCVECCGHLQCSGDDGGGEGGGDDGGGGECFCDPQCDYFGDCCAECCGHIQC